VLTAQSGFDGRQPGSSVCPGMNMGAEKETNGMSVNTKREIFRKDLLFEMLNVLLCIQ